MENSGENETVFPRYFYGGIYERVQIRLTTDMIMYTI